MPSQFSTATASDLTGASVRQIDYWARTGLIRPSGKDASGRGSRRRYTFQDIVALQTVRALRERNCPLQKIRTAIRYLGKHLPDESNAQSLACLTLLTDGISVYMLCDQQQVMDVVTRQMVWAVPLGKLIQETRDRISAIPAAWTQRVDVQGKSYHLDAVRDEDSGEYSVQCRELPGAIEQGHTLPQAVANGREAIEAVLSYLERRKRTAAAGGRHVQVG